MILPMKNHDNIEIQTKGHNTEGEKVTVRAATVNVLSVVGNNNDGANDDEGRKVADDDIRAVVEDLGKEGT